MPRLTEKFHRTTSQGVSWRAGFGVMAVALVASAAAAAVPGDQSSLDDGVGVEVWVEAEILAARGELAEAEHEAAVILGEAKADAAEALAEATANYDAALAKIDEKLAEAAVKGEDKLAEAEAKAKKDRAKAEAEFAKATAKIDAELADAQAEGDAIVSAVFDLVDERIDETWQKTTNDPAIIKALDELAEAELEAPQAIEEARAEHERDLADAQAEYDTELAKIEATFVKESAKGGDKVAKAEDKASEDRAKAEAKLAEATAKIDTDLTKAITKAEDSVTAARKRVEDARAKAEKETQKLIDELTNICSSSVGYSAERTIGSMYNVNEYINADYLWKKGYTGAGIDVAVIDTGTVPVKGLDGDKVIYGPDFSLETHHEAAHQLDTYGHGTHMAGIIAGNDYDTETEELTPGEFQGVAPDARIVSVKVADASGAVDPSQIIAAIDWVIAHRNDNGMNIRVINLSYRAAGTQPYTIDPLAKAVEDAWDAGIVVVVAAGNDGASTAQLGNPGYDPYVIAVSALFEKEQAKSSCRQDKQSWVTTNYASNADKEQRQPDLYAPGSTIVSLRNPNSYVDVNHPQSILGDRFTKGTGTSQSTAIVSGAVALLLDAKPELTPDQVKAILIESAYDRKAPILDIKSALHKSIPDDATQAWPRSNGLGSLEATRGGEHILVNGVPLTGENTLVGPWDPSIRNDMAGSTWSGSTWSGSTWSGSTWSGSTWSGSTWSGSTWSGSTWSGSTWSGSTWSGSTWSGSTWSGSRWD